MMPLIATFFACFIGFLIFAIKNYVTTTNVPYVVLTEEKTRTAAILKAKTSFDTTVLEDMPQNGKDYNAGCILSS